MTKLQFRLLLAWAAGSVAVSIADGSSTEPFALVDHGSKWRSVSIHRSVPPNLTLDQVFQPDGGNERIIVLSSPALSDDYNSLSQFAAQVKRAVAANSSSSVLDQEATRMGHRGRELHFSLNSQSGPFECQLFVFAENGVQWGVLCATPQGLAATQASLFDLLHKEDSPADGLVELPTLRIRGDAITDFPISFRILAQPGVHRVAKIIITQTAVDFSSARNNIEVGDEIVAIDGRAAGEFDSALNKNSELGRIFFNRTSDDEVKLDLVSARTHENYSATLHVARLRNLLGF